MTLLLVMAGGAVGAACRFLVDRAVTARTNGALPWGTLLVNVAGSLLLGLLAGAGSTLPGWLGQLVGTGFCGALTTYSTFSHETVRLADSGPGGRPRALLYVAVTLTLGLGAAALGWLITQPR
ncbi:fluoride efflux transporter CrcB [Micromonospora sonneratiae]|jgi:CrcB protein|uniref:Fluoride-specific ion channel FluC n=1 Tax=Micromonospora sonneratiae TaxID=1184706 RepID=A0ABW3YGX3_9ACTN